MTSISNLGYTSKKLYSFNSTKDIPIPFSGLCFIKNDNSIRHYVNNKLHNLDKNQPAILNKDIYYVHGVISFYSLVKVPNNFSGFCHIYTNDTLNRFICKSLNRNTNHLNQYYYAHFLNGKLHHNNKPSVTYPSGHIEYYQHNQLHRTNGPAVISIDSIEWWLNNIKYGTNNDFNNNSWIHFQKSLLF